MNACSPEAGPFPTLRITADGLSPMGSFAETQARYLRPDPQMVERLDALLSEKKIGVVAHFYMDPELQGVLTRCRHPHIHISDSLAMADRAIAMAQQGARTIVVLGVDFMSENVRAMLDASGYEHVPVYRVATDPIGCSLAEAAEAKAYGAWLTRASKVPHSLHVVYINTSLVTKAKAHAIVPTITCTSSNVVQTVLTAAAQIPDIHIWFGPDTYMGENLERMLETFAELDVEEVKALHPDHTPESIRSLLDRFHYFPEGSCIVHHMFGADVVETVRTSYPDAFITAHLEVPGEMFALGLEAQQKGRGVVGSTSNILAHIKEKVAEEVAREERAHLQFVLGTEAGMITPIVKEVEALLRSHRDAGGEEITVDIVFPVAAEAIAETELATLQVVPGVAAGEGCSTAGGCATCPYMKMNSLTALFEVAERVDVTSKEKLAPYEPKKYQETVKGHSVAELGGEPILYMRHFQSQKGLPDALIEALDAA